MYILILKYRSEFFSCFKSFLSLILLHIIIVIKLISFILTLECKSSYEKCDFLQGGTSEFKIKSSFIDLTLQPCSTCMSVFNRYTTYFFLIILFLIQCLGYNQKNVKKIFDVCFGFIMSFQ